MQNKTEKRKEKFEAIVISSNSMEWMKYILFNSIKREDVFFFQTMYHTIQLKVIRNICKLIYYDSIYSFLGFTKRFFYKSFSNYKTCKDNGVKYFVFVNWERITFDKYFHKYLRYHYPGIKLVLLLTATLQTSMIYFKRLKISINEVKNMFDIICTFDENDAKNESLFHIPLLYNYTQPIKKLELYDCCYVGNAKSRLEQIHNVYKILTENGLRCCFYINGVRELEKKYKDINYNKKISYEESLKLLSYSRCSLEITEDIQRFSTIRLGEIIIFNKKIITNNIFIKNDELYSKDSVFIINENTDLINFVRSIKNNSNTDKREILMKRELFKILDNIIDE